MGFGFAYVEGGPWADSGLQAIVKFFRRIETCVAESAECKTSSVPSKADMTSADKELNFAVNYAIKSSTADIEKFQFNTPIARMMELLNAITKYSLDASAKAEFKRYATEKLVLLLAPFAPHFTEELWCEVLGNGYSVYNQKWPEVDESALVKDEIEIAVQINGKVQFKVNIPAEADQAAVEAIVNADERLAGALAGRSIVKFIYVKGRIANIVAK